MLYLSWLSRMRRSLTIPSQHALIIRQPVREFCEAVSSPSSRTSAIANPKATQRCNWEIGVDGEPVKVARARRLGISTSPHKLNLVARLVRGLSVEEAQRQLAGTLKKHRTEVSACIGAAVVNARSFGMNEKRLIVSKAYVNKGKYLKRIRPWHGKGRYGVEHKKYSHLSIEVRELGDEEWEAKVLPQYLHMRFRPRKETGIAIPEDLVKPWLVRSQLELNLNETKRRTLEVKNRLPPKRHAFPSDWEPDPSLL